MVVGASIAICLPSITALNAARIATSVFPYPTSPHSRRSIGLRDSMSDFTSFFAAALRRGEENLVPAARLADVGGPFAEAVLIAIHLRRVHAHLGVLFGRDVHFAHRQPRAAEKVEDVRSRRC